MLGVFHGLGEALPVLILHPLMFSIAEMFKETLDLLLFLFVLLLFIIYYLSLEIPTGMAATHPELGVLERWDKTEKNKSSEVSFLRMEILALRGRGSCALCPFGEMGSRQTFFQECDLSCSPQEGGKFRHFWDPHVCGTEGSPCQRCWVKTGAFAAVSSSLNVTFQKFLGKGQHLPSVAVPPHCHCSSITEAQGCSLGWWHWD